MTYYLLLNLKDELIIQIKEKFKLNQSKKHIVISIIKTNYIKILIKLS